MIFIDDLDSVVNAIGLFLSKLADNTKAGRVVDSDKQAALLQEDLDNLAQWERCFILWRNSLKDYQKMGLFILLGFLFGPIS